MYQSGLRVYLIFSLLALVGVVAGLNLPISLYPNSSKPSVYVNVGLGGLSPSSFFETYGLDFESRLQSIENSGVDIDKIISNYNNQGVSYEIFFDWGVENDEALSEVEKVVSSLKAGLPQELADSVNVNQWNRSSGFFALSFFSAKRSVDEVYDLTNAIYAPLLSTVKDAENPGIWNPNQKELKIILDQNKLTRYGLLPRHIQTQIIQNMSSYVGGVVKNGNKSLNIKLETNDDPIEKISKTIIRTGRENLYLSDIATVAYETADNHKKIFKTNGSSSLILFASPKGGGNVKKMSEDIIQLVKDHHHKLPNDIQYRILVDPSEFIRSSINNLFHEVAIAALLAVLILFLFIGDIRNVVTSSIEIPLSMIVAFIFMKWFDVNLNLISLGGLALAAGMNVDASVVVLENILRKLKIASKAGTSTLTRFQKLEVIQAAVREVAIPVIVSMLTTLVVFIPIAITSKLTNAVLGDLAKAVIYSHCFSAVVALVLVPTIRYQIIARKDKVVFPKAPLGKLLRRIDSAYDKSLRFFFDRKNLIKAMTVSTFALVAILALVIVPRLPKEIIGKPDSDWIFVWMRATESSHIKEIEQRISKIEDEIMREMKDYFRYTFVQINGKDSGSVMFRVIDKSKSSQALKILQDKLKNTPDTYYHVDQWNPASLPLPQERELKMKVTGPEPTQVLLVTDKLISEIIEQKLYERIWSTPRSELEEIVQINPYLQRWAELAKAGVDLRQSDVVDITRVAKGEKNIGQIVIGDKKSNMIFSFGNSELESLEALRSIPLNVLDKIIPLSALGDIRRTKEKPLIYRENNESLVMVEASLDKSDKRDYKEINKQVAKIVTEQRNAMSQNKINVQLLDPKVELSDALYQLSVALILSLLLIFGALIMQFGNPVSPLIVMMAIPLGLIGVFISLYVFQSTLSLNSVLGMILLNGIAVNNSILLVEFTNKVFQTGESAYNAVLEGARKRLRPILITSLTTIIGMFPIAIGMGEGGKILQPLGIAVSGGLWVSTILTLVLIPAIQFLYLNFLEQKRKDEEIAPDPLVQVPSLDTTHSPEVVQ